MNAEIQETLNIIDQLKSILEKSNVPPQYVEFRDQFLKGVNHLKNVVDAKLEQKNELADSHRIKLHEAIAKMKSIVSEFESKENNI